MQPLSLPNSVLYLLRKILKYNIVQKVANVNNFLHFFIEKSLIFLFGFRNTLFYSLILRFPRFSSFFVDTKKLSATVIFFILRLPFFIFFDY